jgi:hypothetical protein
MRTIAGSTTFAERLGASRGALPFQSGVPWVTDWPGGARLNNREGGGWHATPPGAITVKALKRGGRVSNGSFFRAMEKRHPGSHKALRGHGSRSEVEQRMQHDLGRPSDSAA